MVAVTGEILSEVKVALLTVSVVEPETTGPEIGTKLALIVVLPAATPVAADPTIVATAVLDEVQVVWLVRLCVVPSLKLPVAENDFTAPTPMVGFAGVT